MMIFIFMMIPSFAYAKKMEAGISTFMSARSLTGTIDDTGLSGALVSNSSVNIGVDFNYKLSNKYHILFKYNSTIVEFDNTTEFIIGESKFNLDSIVLGTRWVVHRRVGFRFLISLIKDLAFNVDSDNYVTLYTESLTTMSLHYDQIVLMGKSYYSGFRFGYYLDASSGDISSRGGTKLSVFLKYGKFEGDYEMIEMTKKNDSIGFVEKGVKFKVSYIYPF